MATPACCASLSACAASAGRRHGQPGDGQAGVRHQQMRSVQCQGRVFGSA
jgi:hypothetical protein